jgi:hypothetical protein
MPLNPQDLPAGEEQVREEGLDCQKLTGNEESLQCSDWRSEAQERLRHLFDTPDYKAEGERICHFIQENSQAERQALLARSNSSIAKSRK